MRATRWTSSRRCPRSAPPPQRLRREVRPRLEVLEARLLPATYVVTSTDGSDGGETLAGAIYESNHNPGFNTIDFDIPPGGVQTIHGCMPALTVPVFIDATTQPGYAGTPLIVLDQCGFTIQAPQTTLKGLVIENGGYGIDLRGTGDVITDDYIGTDVTGTQAQPNVYGGILDEAGGNQIGVPGGGNVISGNRGSNLLLRGNGDQVRGNLIGLDATGSRSLGGVLGHGIMVQGRYNTIGGTAPGDRNVVSGNGETGIDVSVGIFNLVLGNYVGTDAAGTAAVGNSTGVQMFGDSDTLGGTAPGAGNLISGNYIGLNQGGPTVAEGNLIGLNAAGTAVLPNTTGVRMIGGTLGGTALGARNVISGNSGDGVLIDVPGGGTVLGNYIGTNPAGTAALPNGGNGITVRGAGSIGGTGAGAGNLISGNHGDGIDLTGGYFPVQGNLIGTNADHTAALPNGRYGISITSPSNTVGGSTSAARNVIAGNSSDGVNLASGANGNFLQDNVIAANGGNGVTIASGAVGNHLLGNAIGTTPGGLHAFPNAGSGLSIAGTSNTVGGTTAGDGNLISANGGAGVLLTGTGAVSNRVQGNLIGTDLSGTLAQPNGGDGITLAAGANRNTIGGTAAGAGNLIAANQGNGIRLMDSGTTANLVQGNTIGTDPSGTLTLGNGRNGVVVLTASGNTIGGTAAGAGNLIANSGSDGVLVDTGTGNAIQQNSIFASSNLGIELLNGGNNSQAAPVLTAVTSDDSGTTIAGTLNSAPDMSFTVEFYANDVCNPSGFGEGQTFLGAATVTTDDSGAATFAVTLDGSVSAGQYVSATATDPAGNTSAFAACWQLPATTLPNAAALRTAVPAALPGTTLAPTQPTAKRPADLQIGSLAVEPGRAAGAEGRGRAAAAVGAAQLPARAADFDEAAADLVGTPQGLDLP